MGAGPVDGTFYSASAEEEERKTEIKKKIKNKPTNWLVR